MANQIGGSVWILDTPGADVIKGGHTMITGATLIDYLADNDEAVLTWDGPAGTTIDPAVKLVGDATLKPVAFAFAEPMVARNLKLKTLTNGKLLLVVM